MKKQHPLVGHFKGADLILRVHEEPLRGGSGMERIVQIDIGRDLRGRNRHEWFRMYLPPGDVVVQVRNVDKAKQQLVLLVREGESTFEEEILFSIWARDTWSEWLARQRENLKPLRNARAGRRTRVKSVHKPGSRASKRGKIVVERTTTSQIRYFLMGKDERQLFIAGLTGPATTVAQAHKLLGASIQFAEGKRKGSKADRQGEWFFLETNQAQRDEISMQLGANKATFHLKADLGAHMSRAGGKPHTVDELVKLAPGPLLRHGFAVRSRQRVFIRGKVCHVDHRTIRFSHWREVVANSEGETAQASSSGVLWVD